MWGRPAAGRRLSSTHSSGKENAAAAGLVDKSAVRDLGDQFQRVGLGQDAQQQQQRQQQRQAPVGGQPTEMASLHAAARSPQPAASLPAKGDSGLLNALQQLQLRCSAACAAAEGAGPCEVRGSPEGRSSQQHVAPVAVRECGPRLQPAYPGLHRTAAYGPYAQLPHDFARLRICSGVQEEVRRWWVAWAVEAYAAGTGARCSKDAPCCCQGCRPACAGMGAAPAAYSRPARCVCPLPCRPASLVSWRCFPRRR